MSHERGPKRRGQADAPGQPLRRRMLVAITGIAAVAVLLFALPLGAAVDRLYRSQAAAQLERDATRAAAVVPDEIAARRSPVVLASPETDRAFVGLYSISGRRIDGSGPVTSALARRGVDGGVHEGIESGELAVVVPILSDGKVAATSRAAMPADVVLDQTLAAWLGMGALGLLVLGVATLLGRHQAARLSAPLERLTAAAAALGAGDFTVEAQRSGIQEADAASRALERTARRLGDMLGRERSFSAEVSHQLRTPLTGLLLGLESSLQRPDGELRDGVRTAVERVVDLEVLVEDLLALARDTAAVAGPVTVTKLLEGVEDRWTGVLAAHGRSLRVDLEPGLPAVRASQPAVRQVLDVLIANALEHGAGTVQVRARDPGAGVAVEVEDEGRGLEGDLSGAFERRSSGSGGRGLGLALARKLTEAGGGRLLVARATPHPVFCLLLPLADP